MAEHPTLGHDEFLDLATAVALDVSSEDDLQRVEQHAATCPECARRLEDFREVASVIGSAVPQHEPPAALRARVFDAVMATERHGRADLLRWRLRRIHRPRFSAPWLVAAASFLFSLGALIWVAALQGQITTLQADAQMARERAIRYDHVAEVLASDKLAIRPLQPLVQNMASQGMLFMDPSSGKGMVMCHNMPPLEQGHAYQVWFVRGSERVSGGLLWTDLHGNGYTLIQVPTDLQSFDSVGLTDEPGTGSAWPTTPRVIGSPLKESAQ
jgi:hypothetical protein